MSSFGITEPFHRLEEFPSFTSCITCFGRSIIPPLLTPSVRLELQQMRAAAVNKEADILKRKKDLKLIDNVSDVLSKDFTYPDLETSKHKSCALWYPSCNDCHEGVSVAISKLPTSGIYSSVHTGAIVCSNVIENSHRFASKSSRDSSFNPESSSLDCIHCSHSNINLDCHLCRAEFDQSFHNCSFGSEISPEVPCRTFSLLQQNAGQIDDEQNSTVEETECESLPTVICSQKHVAPDTDSESNVTCMTQSTDLEKYMEVSCEFSSPDNSAAVWDSRSTSQQYTLSRSDDASSETVVNTENELTPCASTLAELTDNIEDELSIADDTANLSTSKNVAFGTLKRSHSVDSYMKIIQTYARNMHVKKSSSEPLNNLFSGTSDDFKVSSSSKISHLIKEDSKESEESKEIPEKDINAEEKNKDILPSEEISSVTTDQDVCYQKRHVRQNSYTLDEPSVALIEAHGDCSCSLDASCTSPPHCSALKSDEDATFNSAFMKEKVDIPLSMKENYPVLSSNTHIEDASKKDSMSPVKDVFLVVEEVNSEKNNAENSTTAEDVLNSTSACASQSDVVIKGNEDDNPCNERKVNDSSIIANQEYFKLIFHELQEQHELRMRELREEQSRQWLKLQEELKEQEMQFYEKVKQTITSPPGAKPKVDYPNKTEAYSEDKNIASDTYMNHSGDNSFKFKDSDTCSEQSILFNKSDCNLTQIYKSDVLLQSSSSLSYSSAYHNHSESARALITPSSEGKTPKNIQSIPPKNISDTQSIQGMNSSVDYSSECNGDLYTCASSSLHNINGFPSESAVLLPQCDSQVYNDSVISSDENFVSPSHFCEKCSKQCDRCMSYNGYSEYDTYHKYLSSFNSGLNHPATTVNVPNKDSGLVRSNSEDDLNFTCISEEGNDVSHSKVKGVNCGDNSSYFRREVQRTCYENNSNFSKKVVTPPKNIKDSAFVKNSKSMSSPDILQSSRDNKTSSHLSSSDKIKLPVSNILSVCVNSLKSSSASSDAFTNNEIVIDCSILKNFEKLPAFVKGYLTRRLFKTERVQSHIKTLQDTIRLFEHLNEDLSSKGNAVSERDVDFHRQLMVQLMTTFYSVYDIFCTISTKERMNIIAESRNLRLKQKLAEQQPGSAAPVTSKAPVPHPSKKHKLSAATEKTLIRREKKRSSIDSSTYSVEDFRRARSVVENRTYTIEDLNNHTERPHSHIVSKSHSTSPSSVRKVNVGEFPKRKTTSCKTSSSRRHENRWVP